MKSVIVKMALVLWSVKNEYKCKFHVSVSGVYNRSQDAIVDKVEGDFSEQGINEETPLKCDARNFHLRERRSYEMDGPSRERLSIGR